MAVKRHDRAIRRATGRRTVTSQGTATQPPSTRPDRERPAVSQADRESRARYAQLLKEHTRSLEQIDAHRAQNAIGAFGVAAMRSPITGHVYLRGDTIVAHNKRFAAMSRSEGGPWRAPGRPELPTLTEVVRAQSRDLRGPTEVARFARADDERVVEVRTERLGSGPVPLVTATVFDVTAVANAARAAEAARSAAKLEALQEAHRNKDEFLGVLSHELRNPLAPIQNSVYILDRVEPSSEQARRAREVLQRQVSHLSRLVNDLLDVTRIERGKFEIRRGDVDLADLLRRAAEDHRGALQQRGIGLDVDTPGEAVRVVGDEVRIAQAVGNLLHNAAKFTADRGSVKLSLSVVGRSAEIHVRDTGVGMDADLVQHVFEPFAQARQSLARTTGGLGLGLALVKGVVELHGGTVHAESAGRGKGSEFVLRLPLPGALETCHGHATSASPEHTNGTRRVLVVEDNADAAASLADLLRTFGHDVEVAHDGTTALTMARTRRPDVVLCDIGLPGMSGYDVAQALRTMRHRGMRLVAVTGYARPEDVKRASEAGFDAHVAKPFDPETIDGLVSG